jgi:hypothetical protein
LPGRLPAGERILWQGAPNWLALAVSAYFAGPVAIWFLLLMAWRGYTAYSATGGDAAIAALSVAGLLPVAVAGLGLIFFVAYLSARTTVYTITNRRVVLRIGIALPKAINIPFRVIAAAALRERMGTTGDIPLELKGPDRIGYAHLWPHVRPWRLKLPEPMLRAIPEAAAVARLLSAALRDSVGQMTVEAAVQDRPMARTAMDSSDAALVAAPAE